jgi:seryl-tRNA synthetase
MLSIQTIRDHTDDVRRSLERRHTDAPLDEVLDLDKQRRALLVDIEQLNAAKNAASKAIGAAKDQTERDRLISEQRAAPQRLDGLNDELRAVEEKLHDALSQIPNLVHPDTPDGPDEDSNVVLRTSGEIPTFDFQPKPHWELGEALDLIDIDRAAAMSGTRMYMLRGLGAKLQRALIGHFLDAHSDNGYTEVYVPAMVREESMFASGQLPKFRDNLYHDAEADYWFIPTAEVPLTNIHRDEILEQDTLPIRYAAHTPCFRREKVSAGRDVRGIKRVHQFEKVEMYQLTTPDQSSDALAEMLAQAETLLQDLGLTYRVLQICSGDLGFNSALSYDLEVWAPGADEWLEVSSISTCTDYQARRANIRYRPADSKRTQFVHTLNGSGLALPRILAAILETYQNADGSVTVPDVISHRMGRLMKITN